VRAEALYLSKLSPFRLCQSLTFDEMMNLRQQIISVMITSYNFGGATIRTFSDVYGNKGSAQRRFAVYGNKTDPQGNNISREKTQDGRTIWWCPSIQS